MLPGPMALWQFYLVAVASCGLYLPFWIWRTARLFGAGVRYPSTPAWWAIGSLAAPVAACVLFEFNRRATAAAGVRARAAWPALAYLGLYLFWGLTPLGHYVVAFALLMPIPFVFVQSNINRAASSQSDLPHPRRRFRLALALSLTLGFPLLVTTAWFYDWPALRTDLSSRLAGGDVVSGASGLYRITLPASGWRRVTPGTIGDAGADLELVGPGAATWIIAYTAPTPASSLESVVASRRSQLFEQVRTQRYQEKRYFLGGQQDLVPASLATYDVRDGIVAGQYVVLSAELDSHVVELVAYTAEPKQLSGQLRKLLETLSASSKEPAS
ncbi:MAG TPA: hypothetical protein VIJ10_16095 [Vicinamibacteria bacterium]